MGDITAKCIFMYPTNYENIQVFYKKSEDVQCKNMSSRRTITDGASSTLMFAKNR